MRNPRAFWSFFLIPLIVMYGVPQKAHASESFSNGVLVEEHASAFSGSGGKVRSFTISRNGEAMNVSVLSSSLYTTIVTIDDQLVIDYSLRYNSSGNAFVDSATATYNGVSKTIDYAYMQECTPDTPEQEGECFMTVPAQEWVNFVDSAMNSLHSSSFLQAVHDASNEATAQALLGCTVAVLSLAASYVGLWFGCTVGAITVVGCVWALVGHATAVVGFGCSCFGKGC